MNKAGQPTHTTQGTVDGTRSLSGIGGLAPTPAVPATSSPASGTGSNTGTTPAPAPTTPATGSQP